MANALDTIRSTGKTVGYVRVSSKDQNTARQLEGVHLDKVFTDKASGKDKNRPQLVLCMQYLREDDTLLVHSMDRLARDVMDLRDIVKELVDRKVTVRFVKENMTFTPYATSIFDNFMLTLLGAFAEFERAISKERQREGIAIAKAAGKYKGRKPSLTKQQQADLKKMHDMGVPKARIARELKISRPSVYQYLELIEQQEKGDGTGEA